MTLPAPALFLRPVGGVAPPEPPGPSGLTLVQPYQSDSLVEAYGSVVHANFNGTVYDASRMPTYFAKLSAMGVRTIRGTFAEGNPGCLEALNQCATYGIKWLMLVCPEGDAATTNDEATTRNRVRWIADDPVASVVCKAIESINEPDHNRGQNPPPVPPEWAQITVDHTRYIREEVDGYVGNGGLTLADRGTDVVGPALHAVMTKNSYEGDGSVGGFRHWHQLRDLGIVPLIDYAGMHYYPAGWPPAWDLDPRLVDLRDAFGQTIPVWITETGYHTHLNTNRGHKPINEAGSARYAPRAILELCALRSPGPISTTRMIRYETLAGPVDPADPGYHEPYFGFIDAKSLDVNQWRDKAEVAEVTAFLGLLSDPGPAFTPNRVGFEVTGGPADLRYVLTSKRSGEVTAHFWRNDPFWDPRTKQSIPAGFTASTASVAHDGGTFTVSVGASVVSRVL